MEIWKDVKGFEGLYQVSNIGKIFGIMKQKIRSGYIHKDGYVRIGLSYKSKRKQCMVHRLVAEAFIDNPENKPTVNHKNGIKNDNRVENLEWQTYKEQAKHSINTGLTTVKRKEDHHNAKLTNIQVDEIIDLLKNSNLSQSNIGKIYSVTKGVISRIKNGKNWIKETTNRQNYSPNKGYINPQSKLNEDLVREIKVKLARGFSRKQVREEYKVSKTNIQMIATGETWSHVSIPEYTYKKIRNGNAKLTEEIVRNIHKDRLDGLTQKQIWEKYNISRSTVQNILKGKIWKDIYVEIKEG